MAGPVVARADVEISANCEAFVNAHTPNHRDYFSRICDDCYDTAKAACTSGDACIEEQLEEWTFAAQVNATTECSSSANAKAAYVCIDNHVEAWTKAGNCKA
ncbi:hypothetical protein SLS58_005959 [Diplodia intermedia]|uniref:Uncharacterized protein n=1 Tax=Diplodia intermedia TaxID=856260 RepID=A0ABR3TPY0_9PEZI